VIALLLLIGLGGALAYVHITPLQYTAQATLMLTGSAVNPASSDPHDATITVSPDMPTVRSQVQVLESWSMAALVVDRLHLTERSELNGSRPGLLDRAPWLVRAVAWAKHALGLADDSRAVLSSDERRLLTTIDATMRRTSIVTDGRSYVIQIRFRSEDAKLAAVVATTLGQVFLDDQTRYKADSLGRVSESMVQRSAELRKNLNDAEWRLRLFIQQNKMGETKGTSVSQQQLAELNSQVVLATAELAQKEARVATIRSAGQAASPNDASAEVLASPLIQKLREQQSQLAGNISEMTNRYGDRFPALVNLRTALDDLKRTIAAETERTVRSVEMEADIARARMRSLRGSLDTLQRTVSTANTSDVEIAGLQREVDLTGALLNTFLTRSNDATNEKLFIWPDARLVSEAAEPIRPSWPNTYLVIVIGIGCGGLIGFLIAMMRDRLDDGVQAVEKIEAMTGVHCLGLIPKSPPRQLAIGSGDMTGLPRIEAEFTEAIDSIGSGLDLLAADQTQRVVLVTSALRSEGKTNFAVSLARSYATTGQRVLLIDCNLRHPGIARTLKCSDANGLDSLLAGRAPLESPIQIEAASGLHFLPTRSSPDVHKLLSTAILPSLIEEARRHYDLVILDAPALMQLSDPLILWRLANVSVILVRWRKTPLTAVTRALHRLALTNSSRIGLLLTDVAPNSYRRFLAGQIT
jgi:capsular exopolysaccharide synthesis family protein